MNVTSCRCCPFQGGGARSVCNLNRALPMHDGGNQRDPLCPLNDGPVTVTGSDPEWLVKLKKERR
jgi:hypothetical protein